MTATTGDAAPLEAMLNAMVKNMSPCILEQMKKYGCEILDNAGQIYGFDAEEAKRDFIYKIESKDKVIEFSINMPKVHTSYDEKNYNDSLNEIKIIQKHVRTYIIRFKNFEKINYMNHTITYTSINVFTCKNRSKNDEYNKEREWIIGSIINNKLPIDYYKYSLRWFNLRNSIDLYIKELCKMKYIIDIDTVVCEHKAGRGHHYDFKLIINNTYEFKLEFKFNANSVDDTPQFVSPMKPSQYLDSSYEEYYYDNYFIPLVEKYILPLPSKDEYLKKVHSNKPKILEKHQEKYYSGCNKNSKYTNNNDDIEFYEYSKQTSRDSISSFISNYGVKKDKLTNYLLETQKDKYYMLYRNGSIKLQVINIDNYVITEIIKEPHKSRYIAKTKNGNQIKLLLRWKNGNGIAFPAFQLS